MAKATTPRNGFICTSECWLLCKAVFLFHSLVDLFCFDLTSKLPYWAQSFVPKIFYIEEKSRNFFPYTETEYSCSFLPKFNIFVQTRYENNSGESDNALGLSAEELSQRIIDTIDIVKDPLAENRYKESEDPTKVTVHRTSPERGPLTDAWKEDFKAKELPVMCAYKLVKAKFEVWGLQTKVESWAQRVRDCTIVVAFFRSTFILSLFFS